MTPSFYTKMHKKKRPPFTNRIDYELKMIGILFVDADTDEGKLTFKDSCYVRFYIDIGG